MSADLNTDINMNVRKFPLAHHFEDRAQHEESAMVGMWVFLATEVLFFGVLFFAYSTYFAIYRDDFIETSHHLNKWAGLVNTVVLLTSSWLMALAVYHCKRGERGKTSLQLALVFLLGLTFLVIKGFEYHHHYELGLVPGLYFHYSGPESLPARAPLFLFWYFFSTSMHAFHLTIGLGLILWMIYRNQRGHFSAEYALPIEILGLYWHFVDIVWMFLFPLLYLMGSAK